MSRSEILPFNRCVALGFVGILAMMFTIEMQMQTVSGQITFSKDWRAGGKRSSGSPLNGMTVLDVPCDQLSDYSNSKIRDLVKKEAVALLQCEFNTNKNEATATQK